MFYKDNFIVRMLNWLIIKVIVDVKGFFYLVLNSSYLKWVVLCCGNFILLFIVKSCLR